MNLAIILVVVAAQIALADDPTTSILIGRPVRSVTVGASTQTWRGPLDDKITLRIANGTLGSLLDEVSKQTKMKFILVQGVDKCRMSAFLRGMTTREVLQLTLVVGGMTYQGRGGGGYIVARRKDGPDCSPLNEIAKGSCHATGAAPISVECQDGSLSALAEVLYDQTDGSYFVWNEAVDHPISINLRKAKLTKALKKIKKDHSIEVQQVGMGNRYVFATAVRRVAPEGPEVVRSTEAPTGPKRQEPEPNPTFKQRMPN